MMGGVMMDRIKDEAASFPKGVTVKEDVWHSPKGTAVRTGGVVSGGGTKRCGVICVEGVVGSQLESRALKRA
jgi:hypothetical protein